jgi:hypothetical protein
MTITLTSSYEDSQRFGMGHCSMYSIQSLVIPTNFFPHQSSLIPWYKKVETWENSGVFPSFYHKWINLPCKAQPRHQNTSFSCSHNTSNFSTVKMSTLSLRMIHMLVHNNTLQSSVFFKFTPELSFNYNQVRFTSFLSRLATDRTAFTAISSGHRLHRLTSFNIHG